MEVSAKLTSNVEEIFQKLLQQILKAEQNKPKKEELEVPEEEPPQQAPPPPTAGSPTPAKPSKTKKGENCVVQ